MECNREEAEKAMERAEDLYLAHDVAGSYRLAQKAQSLYPSLPYLPHLLAAIRILHVGSPIPYMPTAAFWHVVMGTDPADDDVHAVRRQYHRLCILVHPDKNPSAAATPAFKLLNKAWESLSSSSAGGAGYNYGGGANTQSKPGAGAGSHSGAGGANAQGKPDYNAGAGDGSAGYNYGGSSGYAGGNGNDKTNFGTGASSGNANAGAGPNAQANPGAGPGTSSAKSGAGSNAKRKPGAAPGAHANAKREAGGTSSGQQQQAGGDPNNGQSYTGSNATQNCPECSRVCLRLDFSTLKCAFCNLIMVRDEQNGRFGVVVKMNLGSVSVQGGSSVSIMQASNVEIQQSSNIQVHNATRVHIRGDNITIGHSNMIRIVRDRSR